MSSDAKKILILVLAIAILWGVFGAVGLGIILAVIVSIVNSYQEGKRDVAARRGT